VSAAEERPRHRTLADIYEERPLTPEQVRRLVALLRLTERPASSMRQGTPDAYLDANRVDQTGADVA
jgi:hypothetical protein